MLQLEPPSCGLGDRFCVIVRFIKDANTFRCHLALRIRWKRQ
jgi:hypothetical protein